MGTMREDPPPVVTSRKDSAEAGPKLPLHVSSLGTIKERLSPTPGLLLWSDFLSCPILA